MMRKRISAVAFVLILVISGCNPGKERLNIDVSGVDVRAVKIYRYDLELFKTGNKDLKTHLLNLQATFPFFLGTDLGDPAKIAEMQNYLANPRNLDFHQAVEKQYPGMQEIEDQLTVAFRHLKYYFPEFQPPRVYTYISGGDYNTPAQFVDSVLLIGIDNFLGADFKPYLSDGLPQYKVNRMTRDYMVPVSVNSVLDVILPQELPGNTVLEQIVQAGKRLYLLDAMIPDFPDRIKIGYSEQQYNWMTRNEKHVWAAMITQRMIYSSDTRLFRTFLADAPFTADFSKESPPRMGEWIGWRIVSGYMSNHKSVTLKMLMEEKDAQKILAESDYKPEM